MPTAAMGTGALKTPTTISCQRASFVSAKISRFMANDPSSATRPAGRVNCDQSAMAGFAAVHG